jgi:hypothetical protein
MERIHKLISVEREKSKEDPFYIKVDKSKHVHLIFYQTAQMKNLYKQYGQVLFVDGTYKLNQNRYPVYLFVVQDRHGKSQVVAAAITS